MGDKDEDLIEVEIKVINSNEHSVLLGRMNKKTWVPRRLFREIKKLEDGTGRILAEIPRMMDPGGRKKTAFKKKNPMKGDKTNMKCLDCGENSIHPIRHLTSRNRIKCAACGSVALEVDVMANADSKEKRSKKGSNNRRTEKIKESR